MKPLSQRLREKITIRRAKDASDGKGGFGRSWSTIADNIWAEVVCQNGREAVIAGALQGVSAFKITIRRRDDVLPKDQLLWKGRELNIRAAERDPFDPAATLIIADTEAPQGA